MIKLITKRQGFNTNSSFYKVSPIGEMERIMFCQTNTPLTNERDGFTVGMEEYIKPVKHNLEDEKRMVGDAANILGSLKIALDNYEEGQKTSSPPEDKTSKNISSLKFLWNVDKRYSSHLEDNNQHVVPVIDVCNSAGQTTLIIQTQSKYLGIAKTAIVQADTRYSTAESQVNDTLKGLSLD